MYDLCVAVFLFWHRLCYIGGAYLKCEKAQRALSLFNQP